MDRLFEKIKEVIEAGRQEFTTAGCKPPAVIDWYLGQPSDPGRFEFALPAIFVNYSADYQGEELYLYLHVLSEFGADTDSLAPAGQGEEYMRMLGVIKHLLQGIGLKPVFGRLLLHQETPVETQYFCYHQLTFRCNLNYNTDERFPRYNTAQYTAAVGER